ncbi:MAG TPA: LPS export ABC transporter periplasmic protein LptC [Gemmatimonadaceae bacterium]|nr:LPS export ABC transporter periplasmic protein LptC [Gemmatimonadaceae bacterium]
MIRSAILLLAVAAAIGASACADRSTPPPTRAGLADSADQVMYGARFTLTDAGVRRAELVADTAYFFEDNTRVELDNVHSIFFTQAGVRDAVLTSRHGRYNTRAGDMVAYGNVVVVNEAGRRLTTEELQYNQARNEFFSDSAFTMTEPGRELSGIGFRSDPNMNNMRVLRGASGFATGVATGASDAEPGREPPGADTPATGLPPEPVP